MGFYLGKIPEQSFQGRIIKDPKLSGFEKQVRIVGNYRDHLWEKGPISAIKKGDYLTCYRPVEEDYIDASDASHLRRVVRVKPGAFDPALYDAVTLDPCTKTQSGFSMGLQNNVALEMNGKKVLVTDNHEFAAAFIIEMFRQGVLNSKSSFIHIDDHPDFGRSENFKLSEYVSIPDERAKVAYLSSRARIAGWIRDPLMETEIIDNSWPWVVISRKDGTWGMGDQNNEKIYDGISKLSMIYGEFGRDIVDIDLDVLLPPDERLSKHWLSLVGTRHAVPPEIDRYLKEMAEAASLAKVVTIATSPCYMVQERARAYLMKLLGYMYAA